jgi:L-lysine 2,3-aminomutase
MSNRLYHNYDNADVLIALSEILFDSGVLPYYLHVLDKTQGAAHFDVNNQLAKKIHADMRKALPGYLVPRLAREEAGKECKTLL